MKQFFISLVLLGIMTFFGWNLFVDYDSSKNQLMQNTFLNDEDISGLSQEELDAKLKGLKQRKESETVTFVVGGEEVSAEWKDLGLKMKVEGLSDTIFEGQDLTFVDWFRYRYNLKMYEKKYVVEPQVDMGVYRSFLKKRIDVMSSKPKDASYKVEGMDVKIVPAVDGVKVDTESLVEKVEENYASGEREIIVPTIEQSAKVTEDVLKDNMKNHLVSKYVSPMIGVNPNRDFNVTLAAKKINGSVILPNEEFSFLSKTGDITYEKGYKSAKVFSNGRIILDAGGGVCQVSSALYNAVMMAGLTVTERHNHGMPVGYVPPSRDATIYFPGLDFKFKNPSKSPLTLKAYVQGKNLVIEFYGEKPEFEYEITSRVVRTVAPKTVYDKNPSLKQGQQVVKDSGANGYVSEATLIKKKDGVVISRTSLGQDSYRAPSRIVEYN